MKKDKFSIVKKIAKNNKDLYKINNIVIIQGTMYVKIHIVYL